MSPGPIFEPEGFGEDWWRTARALLRGGLPQGRHRAQHVRLSSDAGRLDPGCRRARARLHRHRRRPRQHRAAARGDPAPEAHGLRRRAGLPEDPARQGQGGRQGRLLASRRRSCRGGALFPSLRAEYKQRGIDTYQSYATADLGIIAYESAGARGHDRRRGRDRGDRAARHRRSGAGGRGRRGGRHHLQPRLPDDPASRTGDLSAVLPGASPCGRTNMRIKGWLGRADQTTKVKGMFVHPEQVAEVAKRHPGLGRVRLVVGRAGEQDIMTLRAEAAECRRRPQGQARRDAAGASPSSRARSSSWRRARCPTTAR